MDPASFSFAVIGMFLTCCKGYSILSNACTAPSDARNAARRVRIESAVLTAWGEHFEIQQGPQSQQGDGKLRIHLMSDPIRSGVFDALCAISETFTDIRSLDSEYGIVFGYFSKGDKSPHIPRDIQDLLNGRELPRSPSLNVVEKVDERMKRELRHYKTKMSLLERCRWSLRGKESIQGLISTLRRHNEDLIRLCTWEGQAQINRGLATLTLPQSKNSVELHVMADISAEAAKDKTSPTAAGRQRIAEMARFKAELMTPSKASQKYQARWRLLDKRDYDINSTSNPYSLGESLRDQHPVFVEWQSYRNVNNQPDKLAEKQIHDLGDFLSVPNRPHEFRALDCIGLFKDSAHDRYGVVYNLPEHLRSLSHRMRTEDRRIFNPSTLTRLIGKVDNMIDLGERFTLAKKLIYSVVALHACGWLHKNISPDNIFFFPGRPAAGERIKHYRKDVGRPFIVGYGLSRRDDIHAERPQLSRQSPEIDDLNTSHPSRRPHIGGHDSDNDDHDKKTSINIYQHPDKVANPNRRFRHSYDIYSLGLVLLEIGLWQDLRSFDTSRCKDAYGFRKFVLERLVPELWGQCGAIYGGVVKECLTMKSDDLELAEEGQRRLAWTIAQRLDKCVA